jgi:nitroreductase
MIRKGFRTVIPLLLTIVTMSFSQSDGTIALPKPQLDKGKPLMQVLAARHSTREFDAKELTMQDLSNLLWAGFGINRPETGGRTAPSAMNKQEIDLYVTIPQGTYLYDAKANALALIVKKDLRSLAGTQPFVKDAPCNIVFVANCKRAKCDVKGPYSAVDAAYISENIYLYCASEGLATVVRASIDKKAFAEAIKLDEQQEVIFGQTIGYEKK